VCHYAECHCAQCRGAANALASAAVRKKKKVSQHYHQRFDARLSGLEGLVGEKPERSRVRFPVVLLSAGEHVEDVVVLALEVLVQVSVQNCKSKTDLLNVVELDPNIPYNFIVHHYDIKYL
jgi:hypothetical protein